MAAVPNSATDDAGVAEARHLVETALKGDAATPSQRLLFTTLYALVFDLRNALAAAGEKRRALESRVAELERQPMQYLGVHENGRRYTKGAFVSEGGALWACVVRETSQRPGDSPDWQLAVKRGRDARPPARA